MMLVKHEKTVIYLMKQLRSKLRKLLINNTTGFEVHHLLSLWGNYGDFFTCLYSVWLLNSSTPVKSLCLCILVRFLICHSKKEKWKCIIASVYTQSLKRLASKKKDPNLGWLVPHLCITTWTDHWSPEHWDQLVSWSTFSLHQSTFN